MIFNTAFKRRVFGKEDVRGGDYKDTAFDACKFIGIVFKFTNFTNCTFKDCDFSESILESVGFSGCKFPGSKLSFLDFGNASVSACSFNEAIAEGCVFQKLKSGSKVDRKKFDLTDCAFDNAVLSKSVFVFCKLTGVGFQKSVLENTIFEKCDLEKTDFGEAKIAGGSFTDCNIKNTILAINGFIDYGYSKGFVLK